MTYQVKPRETASRYYTRRARQERTSAVDAGSAEARSAHLELALRLANIATEPALWGDWSERTAESHDANVGRVLRGAFPIPSSGAFRDLLDAVDSSASKG